MSRWLRLYDDVINDPKVLKLPEASRWHWIAMLCIASKYDGVLPALSDIALLLRMPEHKAAGILAMFAGAGLLDKTETGFAPHNWSGRQYKSDVSTERVKRFRKQQRNVSSAVSETPPDTDTDTDTEQKDSGVVTREASKSTISQEAFEITGDIMRSMGREPDDPIAVGGPYTVQHWLSEGWSREAIMCGVDRAMRNRKHDPPSSLKYFEKAIARAVAEAAAPLPKVEIREAETLQVTHARQHGNIVQAADRLVETIRSFDAGPGDRPAIRSGEGAAPVRLLSKG